MPLGSTVYHLATRIPTPIVRRLQLLANRNLRARIVLARLTAPMRHGAQPIASGPARGLLIDIAGSRPSYLLGTAEPHVVKLLHDYIKPGDTVFDLGANVGYFTLVTAALAGPKGKVVAYEPIPTIFETLRGNVEMNNLTNVETVQAAVSSGEGTAAIGVDSSDQKATLMADRDSGTLMVRTVGLDGEAARVGAPAVIKCDIEGAEYEAFAGSSMTLAAHPVLICEVHRIHEGDEARLEALLLSRGYQLQWIDRGDWTSHLLATVPEAHSRAASPAPPSRQPYVL